MEKSIMKSFDYLQEVMKTSSLEKHPLLYEDYSDEETNLVFHKRDLKRSRARIKGAAFVLTRWPGHLTSVFWYWWIAIGMIVITVMIIYNGLMVLTLVPPISAYIPSQQTDFIFKPTVFFHFLTQNQEDFNITKYQQPINDMILRHGHLEFKVYVLINDTKPVTNSTVLNKTTNSTNVLDLDKSKKSAKVEYILLKDFMNQSPVKAYWQNLPKDTLMFVARAVSIWEAGGITFDPELLLNISNHQNIEKVLKNYAKKPTDLTKSEIDKNTLINANIPNSIEKNKRVNNIQDILEDSKSQSNQVDNLVGEENKKVDVTPPDMINVLTHNNADEINKEHQHSVQAKSAQMNNWPPAPNYIHPYQGNYVHPLIRQFHDSKYGPQVKRIINGKLSLDLKGHILATDTACHALIGAIFSHIANYSGTLTDFIVKEITLFCHGILTECFGIDIIV